VKIPAENRDALAPIACRDSRKRPALEAGSNVSSAIVLLKILLLRWKLPAELSAAVSASSNRNGLEAQPALV